ncbi:hypothetical protein OO17_21795, partial [Rhodopseudomonas palustris]
QLHDAGIVHQYIDAAHIAFDLVPHPQNSLWITDVCLHRERLAASADYLARERLGLWSAASIVDGDSEAILGKTFGNRRTNSARCSCNDCYSLICQYFLLLPSFTDRFYLVMQTSRVVARAVSFLAFLWSD